MLLLKKVLVLFIVVMLLSHVIDVCVCTYGNELEDDVFEQNDENGDLDSMISNIKQSENKAKDIKKAKSENATEDDIFDGNVNAEGMGSGGDVKKNIGELKTEESLDKGQEISKELESEDNTNDPSRFTKHKEEVDNSENASKKSVKEKTNKKEQVGNDEFNEKNNGKTNVQQEKDGDNLIEISQKPVDESMGKVIKKESQREKNRSNYNSNNTLTVFITIIIVVVIFYGVVAWKTKRFLPFRK